MNGNLQQLRDLLSSAKPGESIPVLREDLEHAVKLAETVGLDVSSLLEKFDAVAQGYIARLQRQSRAIGELVGRRLAAEEALRKLAKDAEIPPSVLEAFGGIMTILRTGKLGLL